MQTINYLEMSILTKCLPVMKVMSGLQTSMQYRQGLSIIMEKSMMEV
jgi:hypothetical protein